MTRPRADATVDSVTVTLNMRLTASAPVEDGDDAAAAKDAYMAILDMLVALKAPIPEEA